MAQGKSLRKICQSRRLPSVTTVKDWIVKNPDFAARYKIARQLQADYWAEETIEIADDGRNDTYVDEDGKQCTDNDVIQRSRLRVDARKWIVGKLHPKVYGEKPSETHVNNTVNNFVVFPAERLRELQERKAIALA